MNESSKSKQHFSLWEMSVLSGRVIDIGAGADAVVPNALPFDVQQGDANNITAFESGSFDCVYSSHCLEHMDDPARTIQNWWSLVKPGGYLFVIVPDEDLYEQGVWPSRFSNEHLHTFTISKKKSWSPKSINLFDLCRTLDKGVIRSLVLNDIGYDRSIGFHGTASTNPYYLRLRKYYWSLRKRELIPRVVRFERWIGRKVGWDQLTGQALAQIEAIVQKAV
jgi:SAM-dependent methyltransferase